MATIGEKIKEAREARKWSQADVAKAAGTIQQTIDRLERGETKLSRKLPAILRALGLNQEASAVERDLNTMAANGIMGEDEMPAYAIMDEPGGVLRLTAIKVRNERRIASVISTPGAYGAFMRGTSMAPIFRPGELLLVDPLRAPRAGDRAIFRDADDQASIVKVGELLSETADAWIGQDASGEFTASKEEFPHAHLIVGCLRG
jgi:transcriptional regulator with XRE-family HTH domain